MNDVIITGGSGFIGSHLANYLSSYNYNVYALVVSNDTAIKKISNIKGITIIEGDLFDIDSYIDRLPQNPIAFFHFAWLGVSPEQRENINLQRKNIELTINSVELANRLDAQKFIFPGSTFEYIYSNTIINRDTVPSPSDAYGVAKISSKYFAQVLCKKYGISFIYSVISSIYSEDRIDNNVISYTIKSLLRNEIPALTKLEQRWDYVHIDDVVDAFEHIIRRGKNDAFYVIGHGDNCPLFEYIYRIRDLIDEKCELGIGAIPYKNNIIPMSCVDLTELEKDTGYIPKIDFANGISKVITRIKEMEKIQ